MEIGTLGWAGPRKVPASLLPDNVVYTDSNNVFTEDQTLTHNVLGNIITLSPYTGVIALLDGTGNSVVLDPSSPIVSLSDSSGETTSLFPFQLFITGFSPDITLNDLYTTTETQISWTTTTIDWRVNSDWTGSIYEYGFVNGPATNISQHLDGTIHFMVAPTGTSLDPITWTDALVIANNGDVTLSGNLLLPSKTQNFVFAAPSGSSGIPGFRVLVAGDLPADVAYIDVTNTFTQSQLIVAPNLTIQDAATPTKGYRFRTNGAALDLEISGVALAISGWTGANFTGSQRYFFELDPSNNKFNMKAGFFPDLHLTQDMGATANYWNNVYARTLVLNSTATIDGITPGLVNISGALAVGGVNVPADQLALVWMEVS